MKQINWHTNKLTNIFLCMHSLFMCTTHKSDHLRGRDYFEVKLNIPEEKNTMVSVFSSHGFYSDLSGVDYIEQAGSVIGD